MGTLSELLGLQVITIHGHPITLPAPLSDINAAIAPHHHRQHKAQPDKVVHQLRHQQSAEQRTEKTEAHGDRYK